MLAASEHLIVPHVPCDGIRWFALWPSLVLRSAWQTCNSLDPPSCRWVPHALTSSQLGGCPALLVNYWEWLGERLCQVLQHPWMTPVWPHQLRNVWHIQEVTYRKKESLETLHSPPELPALSARVYKLSFFLFPEAALCFSKADLPCHLVFWCIRTACCSTF